MGIRLLILSRGRSNSILNNTLKVFPDWVEVLVPESEREEYESRIPNPVLTVPDSIEGLGRLRNWVLDSFDDETIGQIEFLCEYYKMSQTALIEFLVNREYKEKEEARQ